MPEMDIAGYGLARIVGIAQPHRASEKGEIEGGPTETQACFAEAVFLERRGEAESDGLGFGAGIVQGKGEVVVNGIVAVSFVGGIGITGS